MVAAGYSVFGSATMLVISTGNGVNGFTLDPVRNERKDSTREGREEKQRGI